MTGRIDHDRRHPRSIRSPRMHTSSPILLAALLALPGLAVAQVPPAPVAETFAFKFQPPDGIRVRLSYKLQRSRLIEGQPPTKDESETQTEGRFRRSGDGYEYSPRTTAIAMRRNGAPINDPILGLLAKVPVTYLISAGGEAVSVKGFGEIDALMKASLAPQVAAALKPLLNEASLVANEKAEWNARYADFADADFTMGEVIDVEAPQQLPNGQTMTYTVRTRFAGWEACPAGRCVRIEQVYESDAAELAKMAQGVATRVADAASMPSVATGASSAAPARVTGSLVRSIDPKTMLIYAEEVRRVMSMKLQLPGLGLLPVVQEEVRVYAYRYD